MNSRQRRGQRREFRHVATLGVPADKSGWLARITAMEEWCHARYGTGRYRYTWKGWGPSDGPAFCFKTEADMMEFAMVWA